MKRWVFEDGSWPYVASERRSWLVEDWMEGLLMPNEEEEEEEVRFEEEEEEMVEESNVDGKAQA